MRWYLIVPDEQWVPGYLFGPFQFDKIEPRPCKVIAMRLLKETVKDPLFLVGHSYLQKCLQLETSESTSQSRRTLVTAAMTIVLRSKLTDVNLGSDENMVLMGNDGRTSSWIPLRTSWWWLQHDVPAHVHVFRMPESMEKTSEKRFMSGWNMLDLHCVWGK